MTGHSLHRCMAAMALVAALCACGGDDSGTSTTDATDTGTSGMEDAGGGGSDAADDSSTVDTANGGTEDVDDGRLALGEFCTEDNECRTDFCFSLAAGTQGFCSQFCLQQDDCPADGFDCIFTQSDPDEIARVCVPSDFCLDEDNDNYGTGPGCLGSDCDDSNPNRNPAQTEICDEIDNDCDGVVDGDTVESNVECDTGIPGVCAQGIQRCFFGELECETTRFAGSESCDGLDNDCDGLTDEDDNGDPLSEVCYSGPEGTADVGQCATGLRTCQAGQFSLCVGQALPLLETCDGRDNDCDGEIDNGMPGAGAACDTGELGLCRAGQTICDADGDIVCARQEDPSEETCDGRDNDCDGEIDEDEDGEPLARACYDGPEGTQDLGLCVGGIQTCLDGLYGVCEGQVLPRDEVCDGADNNCDGTPDEGNPAGGQFCSTGLLGECNEGETVCGDDGLDCVPLRQPTEEICDNRDNDCDGEVDEAEGGDPLTESCYTGPDGTLGQGDCQAGTRTCVGGVFTSCQGQVLPQTEICDGEDNDCDGTPDDTPQGEGAQCATGLQGLCAMGQNVCSDGVMDCVAEAEPSAETCDGLDNDCDGAVDEDEGGDPLTQACYNGPGGTADVGICRTGAQTCAGGRYTSCIGEVRPASVELCNGRDDDCDGDEDEDNPGSGFVCSVPGAQGVCSQGVTACTEGGVVCVPQNTASAEVCDGLDNDCDGFVDEDEGGDPLTQSCYDGPDDTLGEGECAAGAQTCQGGRFGACVGQVLPEDDFCGDGLDNDCNGEADDGDPEIGQVCSTGRPGICAQGIKVCGDEGIVCVANTTAQPETCNGRDDDCDGLVDEDEDGDPLEQSCYGGPANTANVGICRRGMQVCQAGQFSSCQGQVLPQTEICDNVDNDCSGTPDDNLAPEEVGVACTTGEPGVCAPGETACTNGAIVCVGDTEGGPESCDGIDNDCDGAIDNGFAGLGETCFQGQGVCERAGVRICNPANRAGAPICDAVAADGNDDEQCDYLDDDCDGAVDEDFVNAQGVYNTLAHCGGCGVDCNNLWPGGPALYNVSLSCQASADDAQCAFACTGGYIDIDGVPDNGCEFLPDADAIYVAAPVNGGGDAGACGTYDSPCATIARGLARAQSANRGRVRVSSGQYIENVTLVEGIDLLGGHNPTNWSRNPAIFVSAITGQTLNPSGPDRMAVVADSIDRATEFSGFTVNAENAGIGGNSVGIYVFDSDANLTIRDNVVFAGAGGSGTAGAPGRSGDPGTNGADGITSFECDFTEYPGACLIRAGGAGGSRTCLNPNNSTTNVSGGAGGTSNDPLVSTTSGSGVTGNGPSSGAGGTGASNAYGTFGGGVSTCNFYGNAEPVPGGVGSTGSDGIGGDAPADTDGAFSAAASHWRGASGEDGEHGGHGGGGGGGGAGGGMDAVDINLDGFVDLGEIHFGASGGGGGSGGCAGFAGTAGTPGGGSFAVTVGFSGAGPNNANDLPVLTDNILVRGQGGQGGRGGDGGGGGDPGLGSSGGDGLEAGTPCTQNNDCIDGRACGDDGFCEGTFFAFCLTDGGVGSEGGRGGHGGGGAGGNGGASFDIYLANVNGLDPGYDDDNAFVLDTDTDTSGVGGAGGNSSNRPAGIGDEGNAGSFGNVLAHP